MRIGVYGGSFNPIHNGHLEVIRKVLKGNSVDEVWVLPCKNHAFDKDLAPLDPRLDMLKEAIRDMNGVRIDYTEMLSQGKNYTATTLANLRKDHPGKEFYFILGSDALNDIEKWHDNAYIKDTTPLILIKRPGFPLSGTSGVRLEQVIEAVSDLSSTDVRERVACGESIRDMVPEGVERYILKNGLYKNNVRFNNPGNTADLIVEVDGGILFVKRKHSPFKGYWAFPGGYLEYGKESLEEAGVRELFEETSLKAKPEDLELLGVYSAPGRDPRGHVISHTYVVKRFTGKMQANDDAAELAVFREKPEKLAFDHSKMYDDYMEYKARHGRN